MIYSMQKFQDCNDSLVRGKFGASKAYLKKKKGKKTIPTTELKKLKN